MNKINKVIICSGGQLSDWAIPHLSQYDYLIGADRGALFLIEHGFTPDIAIGDFDSVTEAEYELIKLSSKQMMSFDAIDKDYTDTELSLHHAMEQEPAEIVILGGLGTRLDHSIGNIQLLSLTLEAGIHTELIDLHNSIQLMNDRLVIRKSHYKNVSLLPYSHIASGINLIGFKYPLHNATIAKGESIGISNEILDEQGMISIQDGILLVIQSND